MKNILIASVAVMAAGCTNAQTLFVTGDYGAMLEAMKGGGSVYQRPDGKQGFRYVIEAQVFDDLPAAEREPTRLEMLGRWLGSNNYCGKGYTIDSRRVNKSPAAMIYEGHCK